MPKFIAVEIDLLGTNLIRVEAKDSKGVREKLKQRDIVQIQEWVKGWPDEK